MLVVWSYRSRNRDQKMSAISALRSYNRRSEPKARGNVSCGGANAQKLLLNKELATSHQSELTPKAPPHPGIRGAIMNCSTTSKAYYNSFNPFFRISRSSLPFFSTTVEFDTTVDVSSKSTSAARVPHHSISFHLPDLTPKSTNHHCLNYHLSRIGPFCTYLRVDKIRSNNVVAMS